MTLVAGLYRQYRPVDRRSQQQPGDADLEKLFKKMGVGAGAGAGGDLDTTAEYERRRKEKEEKQLAKKKAKELKEKKAEEEAKRKRNTLKRQPFDFEKVRDISCLVGRITNASPRPMVLRRSHRYSLPLQMLLKRLTISSTLLLWSIPRQTACCPTSAFRNV